MFAFGFRALVLVCLACSVLACAPVKPPASAPVPRTESSAVATPAGAPEVERVKTQVFSSETPRSTASGVRYTAPAGWRVTTGERITTIAAPEGNLNLAIVESGPQELDAAIAEAWRRYGHVPPLRKKIVDGIPSGGWKRSRAYVYELPPDERRVVVAEMRWHGEGAVVLLLDAAGATREKRSGQFAVLDASVQPPGYAHATFAYKTANKLRGERLAQLDAFIEHSLAELSIPGAAIAVAQDGEVVHARGYGIRELGKSPSVGAGTLFRIASNTKALTSLLLARLVDARVLRWEQPVAEVYPGFELGDSTTTASVHIEHLLCACTGLPRSDLQRLFEFDKATPERTMSGLSRLRPTTGFGEAFQYSNELAAAAGFVAAHALAPTRSLGEGYDRAMQQWVFEPLGMRSTTFDYPRALRADHATGHTWSIPGGGATAVIQPTSLDRATRSIRPAGGAWSNVADMIRYIQLELENGIARDGRRLVSELNLLRRRERYAVIGRDAYYGIGLSVDRRSGTPVIGHEGYTFGYYSKILWLPEHRLGAVLLANADAGSMLGEAFEGYLLELLFDAPPKSEARMSEQAAFSRQELSSLLAEMSIPAAADLSAALATHYISPGLGRLDVERAGGATKFNFGEWQSEVASRVHTDGSVSFKTVTPGFDIFEFTADRMDNGKRRLTLRDAQHEYAFVEVR